MWQGYPGVHRKSSHHAIRRLALGQSHVEEVAALIIRSALSGKSSLKCRRHRK